MKRRILYLLGVLPVTYAVLLLATLPAAFLFPPDALLQSTLAVPLFSVLGGIVAGWIIPRALTPRDRRTKAQVRRATRFVAWLHLAACLLAMCAILWGVVTVTEAVALAAIGILVAHAMAYRRLSVG